MSRTGDYSHEMTAPQLIDIDDTTAEALLSGAPVPAEVAPVADLVRMLRACASTPVSPTPALAAMLATGKLGDVREPRSPVYRPQGRGLGAAASRTTRTAVRQLAAVPRKLRWVAVGAAAAAAVVGAGSAGFAGALPEPVQQQFETVVESVTRYDFPARPGGPPGDGSQHDQDGGDGEGTGPDTGNQAPGQGDPGQGNPGQGDQHRPGDLPTPSGPPDGQPGQGQQPDDPGPPDDLPGNPGSGAGPGQGPGSGPGQGPPDGPPGQGEQHRPPAPPGPGPPG